MWRLLLLLFTVSLIAEQEDSSLFHHVSVISGHLNLSLQDALIPSAEPLALFRTYTSAGALERSEENSDLELKICRGGWLIQGGWDLLPHANLLIIPGQAKEHFKVYLHEKTGALIAYTFTHREGRSRLHFKPSKPITRHASSLTADDNLNNTRICLDIRKGNATVTLPDGTLRSYEGAPIIPQPPRRGSQVFYRLLSETLPNQHHILYEYDNKQRLVAVKTTNPSKTHTYSSLRFTLEYTKTPFRFQAHTSNSQGVAYEALDYKGRDYINRVHNLSKPTQDFTYEPSGNGQGARLTHMSFDRKLQFEAHYMEKKAAQVHMLKAPVGPEGKLIPIAKFIYHDGWTEVSDVQGIKTRYHYNDDKLYRIEYLDHRDLIHSKTRMLWNGTHLKAKASCDPSGKAFFSKSFTYDDRGNVTQETLFGNLTGAKDTIYELKDNGSLPGAESYVKTFTYHPRFNVPVWIREENGLRYHHHYLNHTNLLSAQFTYFHDKLLLRTFYLYDRDNLLIAEIIDNGTTEKQDDLTDVTQRTFCRYTHHPQHGLPETITNSYLDLATGEEHLIQKRRLTYSTQNQVIEEAIYDSTGTYRYTLYTTYDSHGNILSKTDPLGQTNFYTYNTHNQLLTSKEIGSPLKHYEYAPTDYPTTCIETDGQGVIQTTHSHYDTKGRLTSQINSLGHATTQQYDSLGNCISTVFPSTEQPIEMKYAYDPLGNLTAVIDPLQSTTHTRYTTYRKPYQITHPDGTQTSHRYDKTGLLLHTTHPDGTTTAYQYDPFQRMTYKAIYDASGHCLLEERWEYNAFHLTQYTDARGLTTLYIYDGAGRKIAEQVGDRQITYTYDPLGFLIRTQTGDYAKVQEIDVAGRITTQWEENGTALENKTHFFYDDENRKIKAQRYTEQGPAFDHFTYDRQGRLASHTDPLQGITQFTWLQVHNSSGQLVDQKKTIDPLSNQTIETFDILNHLVRLEKKDPQGITVALEERTYDAAGHECKRISTYFSRQAPAHTIEWEYDLMGRPISQLESNQKLTTYTYHPSGKLASKTLPSGITLYFTYDSLERLTTCRSDDGTIHTTYDYHPDHLHIDMYDHVTGIAIHRLLNEHGELIQETDHTGKILSWDYDNQGHCTQLILPDTSSIRYQHEGQHLIRLDRYDSNNAPIYHHIYSRFDPNGRIIEEQLPKDLGTISTTYDLCERPHTRTSPWSHLENTYDARYRLTHQKNTFFPDKAYTYDALHQLIQEGSHTYSFDSLGNPLNGTLNACNQLLTTPDFTLNYDTDGYLLSKNSPDQECLFAFDPLGRLIRITHPGKRKIEYRYDPLSRLYDKTTFRYQKGTWQPIDHLVYLYDKEIEIGTLKDNQITTLRVLGQGIAADLQATVAIELDHTLYIPLHDLQGNAIALINAKGRLVETYPMTAFGQEKKHTFLNPWRFQSKRHEEGLVFFGKRFYDPSLQRWLSPDPADFTDGVNLYVFVLNSPQNRLDLFGLSSFENSKTRGLYIEVPIAVFELAALPLLIQCSGYVNGIPVDWVVSCGHWHQLTFTTEEENAKCVNIADHFAQLIPNQGAMIGLVTAQNGVFNTYDEFTYEMCDSIVKKIPEGTLFIGIYNPCSPLRQTAKNIFNGLFSDKETITITKTRQFFCLTAEQIDKINPDILWNHHMHSEGGLIATSAIQKCVIEHKNLFNKHLLVLGLGPANVLMKSWVKESKNVYSQGDFITGWVGNMALKYPDLCHAEIVPAISTPEQKMNGWIDHLFLGDTYQNELQKFIQRKRDESGFYGIKIP